MGKKSKRIGKNSDNKEVGAGLTLNSLGETSHTNTGTTSLSSTGTAKIPIGNDKNPNSLKIRNISGQKIKDKEGVLNLNWHNLDKPGAYGRDSMTLSPVTGRDKRNNLKPMNGSSDVSSLLDKTTLDRVLKGDPTVGKSNPTSQSYAATPALPLLYHSSPSPSSTLAISAPVFSQLAPSTPSSLC